MSYAANLGRDRIIKMLYDLGARDLESGNRSRCVAKQDRHSANAARVDGLTTSAGRRTRWTSLHAERIRHGVRARSSARRLSTRTARDSRRSTSCSKPTAASQQQKHEILELYVQHGLELPDTPVMALHRGRIDLLEEHLRRDPQLLRTNIHARRDLSAGVSDVMTKCWRRKARLWRARRCLHLCVDYDEIEIARWLLERGMDPNAKAAVDADGFGGHTALFATVVSQPNFWMNYARQPQVAPFTQLLLDHGADPNVRASLRKKLHPGYGPRYDVEKTYEYRNVTPLGWGRQFHARVFVSEPAMRLIEEHGGHE